MQVILREGHEKLGAVGTEVTVADGYARNFLIPRKIAVKATAASRISLKNELQQKSRKLEKMKGEALSLCEKMAAVTLSFERKASSEGKLFGSVTSQEIAYGLKEKGFEIDRKKLELGQTIKTIGNHLVKIRIHHEIKAEITVEVRAEAVEEEVPDEATIVADEAALEATAEEVPSEQE